MWGRYGEIVEEELQLAHLDRGDMGRCGGAMGRSWKRSCSSRTCSRSYASTARTHSPAAHAPRPPGRVPLGWIFHVCTASHTERVQPSTCRVRVRSRIRDSLPHRARATEHLQG